MLSRSVPVHGHRRGDLCIVCVRCCIKGIWIDRVRAKGQKASFEERRCAKAPLGFTDP